MIDEDVTVDQPNADSGTYVASQAVGSLDGMSDGSYSGLMGAKAMPVGYSPDGSADDDKPWT